MGEALGMSLVCWPSLESTAAAHRPAAGVEIWFAHVDAGQLLAHHCRNTN
jgi:hypothetical protein